MRITPTDIGPVIDAAVAAASPADLPGLLGQLETAKAVVWSRILTSTSPAPPRNPTAGTTVQLVDSPEMARLASMPEHWIRTQARFWQKTDGREGIPCIKRGHYVRFEPGAVLAAIRGRH